MENLNQINSQETKRNLRKTRRTNKERDYLRERVKSLVEDEHPESAIHLLLGITQNLAKSLCFEVLMKNPDLAQKLNNPKYFLYPSGVKLKDVDAFESFDAEYIKIEKTDDCFTITPFEINNNCDADLNN